MEKPWSGTELDIGPEAIADLFAGHAPDAVPDVATARRSKERIRRFYDRINASLGESLYAEDAVFLNFGYLPDGCRRAARIELPRHWPSRNRVDLVLELIGGCDLTGCAVLDAGCGRGGPIATVDHFFAASEIWGLDLSMSAIAFCRQQHGEPYIHFVRGDAECLPFAGGAFDFLINLESSCLYPDVYAFFREVNRILGPGGRFLYADLMPAARIDTYRAYLRSLGLTLERDQNVTGNILRSLAADAGRQAEAFSGWVSPAALELFLAVPGSGPYRDLQEGRSQYRIWQFCKGS